MDAKTLDYYSRDAGALAQRYDSVASPVAPYFAVAFPAGSRVLDVGAGSGRDLAALLASGYDAWGIEPSAGLREAAVANHPAIIGRIEDGTLPGLGSPFGGSFDGVMCSAVLMHLSEADLFDAALAVRALLRPRGRLLVSLPRTRTDVGPQDRDAHGRLFKAYAAEEVQLLFERMGFQLIGRWDTQDALARAGTNWYTLLLELTTGSAIRPIDQIEGILNRDRKVATYKFALFRALAEIATQETRAARWLQQGRVAVPIERIAARWMIYYWPIFASGRLIPQSQSEGKDGLQPVAFRRPLQELMSAFANQGSHSGLAAWHAASAAGRLPADIGRLQKNALKSIENTIRSGPVAFAGGALQSGPVFDFDSKTRSVVMSADLWRELCLLGHWIIDAVIVRWATLTERFAHRQGITSGEVLPLLLARPSPERATMLAREVYRAAGVQHCVWSGRYLTEAKFAVDHVIPFSLWGNNDLWNLLPTHPVVNGEKSDKLPSSDLLLSRRGDVVMSWQIARHALPEAFDQQAQQLLGRSLATCRTWEDELFARLREAVELTSLQRGVERWSPKILQTR